MIDSEQLDKNLLVGYLDNLGKDILQQMIDLYIQQSVTYLSEIEQAIACESQELWQEHCHKMKGAAGSVGFLLVHAKLVSIEKSTKAWVDKKIDFQELSLVNKKAVSEFKIWLAQQ